MVLACGPLSAPMFLGFGSSRVGPGLWHYLLPLDLLALLVPLNLPLSLIGVIVVLQRFCLI